MRISCVMCCKDMGDENPHLICLPEYSDLECLKCMSAFFPDAIVVGAYQDGEYSRAYVAHKGSERINYTKVNSDGITKGSGNREQCPVYSVGDVCVGVLICIDVDDPIFSNAIIDSVKSSKKRWRILCVPADMHNSWFNNGGLTAKFGGVYVVLSNNSKSHPDNRCLSFIASDKRKIIMRQEEQHPLHDMLPL